MRMIAGLEEITSGDLVIGEERVNDKPPKDRDIAMVFQNYGLYPHMSVEQNIGYPLKLRGFSKSERKAQVRQTADMDEPLSNLDAKLRVSMRAELKHLHHELGVTTVYVTHDQMEAMTLASRIAVMQNGRIVQLDTPRNIYSEPANLFVAGFIGSPSMNLVVGDVEKGRFQAPGISLPLKSDDRKNVVLGVRPEDIELTDDSGPIAAPIYALELTGDSTLITVRDGKTLVCARGPSTFAADIDSFCHLKPKADAKLHLFDEATGERLSPPLEMIA